MSLDAYDFAGAATTRAQMRESATASADPDIAAVLSRPDTPDELLSRPFQAVSDLGTLHGPADGPVQVPDLAADSALNGTIDTADDDACALLYQRVLLRGTADLQSQVISRVRLRGLWPRLTRDLPSAVSEVWEQRFAELALPGQAGPDE
ncbi:hypothetical protein ACFWGI_06480 [Streptomyces niveus]|uniref:hypothetical protein n=1 Tax=Streptomyces niveus TaxID=193462 RepID=UPI0036644868